MNAWAWLCGVPGVLRGFREADAATEPVEQFSRWFALAKQARIYQPNAFSLSTVSGGMPSSRMLLLKGFDARGFVFYTNYHSRKGRELAGNPRGAMLFFWSELHRQVRIEGVLSRVTTEESTAYFHSRPRGSQLGAWASAQSEPLKRREDLIAREADLERQYKGREVPLPPHWGGFRLLPDRYEFWQGRRYRLHDRLVYVRAGNAWRIERLYP
ncbi:MAG TPA: pyridoxamine 5'-phosphate oxidase [Kiritimatiellia bacterium]|nr:pyridoxamine 5'-phosphate oxidase [Kiritimatiellia bacterium]